MSNTETTTLFEQIMNPVLPLLKEEADKMGKDASTYKLSLFILYAESLVRDYEKDKEYRFARDRYRNFAGRKGPRPGKSISFDVFGSLCTL